MPAHRLSPSGPYLTAPEVANLAAFRDVSSDLVWVESLLCYWHLNATSALAPDGITVIAAATAGNWERITSTTAPDWLAQAAWTIDPALGDDENAGGAATPLASFDELNRRLSVGAIQQDVTAVVVASVDHCYLELDLGDFHFTIEGEPTTVLTDEIATYADRNHATPVASRTTAVGIADWTPYEGMRIRVTAGVAVGTLAWISRADPQGAGVDVARTSVYAVAPFGATLDPVAGDTFVLETLPNIGDVRIGAVARPSAVGVNRLRINSVRASKISLSGVLTDVRNGIAVDGIQLQPADPIQSAVLIADNASNVSVYRSCFQNSLSAVVRGVTLADCLMRNMSFPSEIRADLPCDVQNCLFDGAPLQLFTGGIRFADTQLFDAGTTPAIDVECPDLTLWDSVSGNGQQIGMVIGWVGGRLHLNSQIGYDEVFNLQGSVADIRILSNPGADIDLDIVDDLPFNGNDQKGIATLVLGTATVLARAANTLGVNVSKATGIGVARGMVEAPTASRTATQFVINAVDAAGALVVADVSTVDWRIPGMARGIRIFAIGSNGGAN